MQHKRTRAEGEDVALLVRRRRLERGMSIRGLARVAGISAAIVSRIERGATSPSFATLKKILDVFGLTFGEFFTASRPEDDSPVIRAEAMREVGGIGAGLKVILVNAGRGKDLQLFHEEYAPGGHSGKDMLRHASVEAGVCISGELVMEVGGREYSVAAGDGWFFDSRLPHRFSNRSGKKAVLISANTPAVF